MRNLVPACTKEVEDRQKARIEEELQSARIAAGLIPSDAKGKRKRNRRRATQAKKEENTDKDAELGLHKLEVLTHTIGEYRGSMVVNSHAPPSNTLIALQCVPDYIYQLEARIEELETGVRPARIRRVIDRDEEPDEEEEEEDEESINKDGPDVKMDVRQQGNKAAEQQQADDDDDDDDGEAPVRRIRRRGSVLNIASLTSPDPSLHRGAHRSSHIKEGSSESSSTSSNASPPLTDATSPMFSATRNGSSCVSSLTSPFMSLSASSPILLGTKGGRTSPTQAYFGHLALPPSALSGFTNGTRGATTFHTQRRAGDASSARTPHGSLSAIRSDAMSNGISTGDEHRPSPGVNDASAAELLLAFSNSPEDALRPVGATPRPGSTARRARISLPRRKTASGSVAQQGMRCHPNANPANSAFAQERGQAQGRERKFSSAVTASAPGGAVAVEERRLLSPPLLALDDPTRAH